MPILPYIRIIAAATKPNQVKSYSLKAGKNLIGRAKGMDLVVDDATASRVHAEIDYDPENGTLTLRDLGSANGTFVNQARITNPQRLTPDALIHIGECMLTVEWQESDAAVTTLPLAPQVETAPLTRALFFEVLGRHTRLLYDVAARLNTALDNETALSEVAALAQESMGADKCMVIVADQFDQLHELGFPSTFARQAIEQKAAVIIPDIGSEAVRAGATAMLLRVRSALCVPVLAGDDVLALVYAYKTNPAAPPFNQVDLQVAVAISHQAALTLQRTALVKQAEQVLRESAQRVQMVVSSSPDIIFTVDMRTLKPTLLNRDNFFGYSRLEFENLDVRSLSVQAEAVRAYWERLTQHKPANNPVESLEYRLYDRAGVGEWVQSRAVVFEFSPADEPKQILVTLTVITAHKQAEERLRKSEAMLAEAQQLAHLGNWEWNLSDNVITGSNEFRRMYGLESDLAEMRPANVLNTIHTADRFRVLRVIGQALKTRQPFTLFHRRLLFTGEVRIYHVLGWVVVNETGEQIVMYGTAQDATEIQQTTRALKRRGDELQTVNAIVTTLNSSMEVSVILTSTLEMIAQLLAVDGAACHILGESGQLRLAAHYGLAPYLKTDSLDQQAPVDLELTQAILASQAPFEVADLQNDPRFRPSDLTRQAHYRAALALPILGRDGLLGTLALYFNQARAFDQDTANLLLTISAQLGVALERITLYATQLKRTEELTRSSALITALSRVAARLQATLNPDRVIEALGAELRSLGVICFLFLINPPDDTLMLHYASLDEPTPTRTEPPTRNKLRGILLAPGHFPFYDSLVRQRRGMYLPNTQPLTLAMSNTRLGNTPKQAHDLARAMSGASMILLPLAIENRLLGILAVAGSGLKQDDVPAFSAFGGEVAVVFENARLFKEVRTSRERLSKLTKQVMSAQEDERRRVARELHDEAGQALTALKITLDLIRDDLPRQSGGLNERLGEASKLADSTLQEIRLLAQALRPPSLDALHNISLTLEVLCRDFARRTKLDINYAGTELPTLSDEVNICLYRFMQEALTNIAKHAQARRVWVVLQREHDNISLTVEDDGVGLMIETETEPGTIWGMGLLGMQERLELLGGRFEIESHPGEGTRVIAHLSGVVKSGTKELA